MFSWIILAITFFIVEILTPGVFFFSCLGIGALLAAITKLITTNWLVPWVVFIISSVAVVYFIRPMIQRVVRFMPAKTGIDALVGKRVAVIEQINPETGSGMVKVNGELWRARAEENIPKGVFVEVVKIEGTYLIVKRVE